MGIVIEKSCANSPGLCHRALPLALAALVSANGAQAFEFDTGNPDFTVRWDNTFKYNLKIRAQELDQDIPATGGALALLGDDADLGWERGDVVNNRLDVLSEMDIVWKSKFGVRISAAGWYDHAYSDENNHPGYNEYLEAAADNGLYADTWGALSSRPGELTDDAKEIHYRGAEILDAFVFANFSFDNGIGASVRAGRHALYWGNSLLFSGAIHGIAGGMATIDGQKAFSVPGTEAKELFRPTNKLSGTVQLSPNLSLVGYYSLEYEEHRLPAAHTYHSQAEGITLDDEFVTLLPGLVDPATLESIKPRSGLVQVGEEKPDDTGEWGAGINYYLEDSGWDLGLYYINYHDKLPQGLNGAVDLGQFANANDLAVVVNIFPAFNNGEPAPLPGQLNVANGAYPAQQIGEYNWVFKEDVKLIGFSAANEFWGMSFGMDLVYRMDTPLNPFLNGQLLHMNNVPDLPPALFDALNANLSANGFTLDNWDVSAYDSGNYPGAVGDSVHFVLNGLQFLSPSRFYDGGTWLFETTLSKVTKVTENEQLLNPRLDGKDTLGTIAVTFAPKWFQVIPGLDLALPINISYNFMGEVAPQIFGGTHEYGSGAVTLRADYQQVWQADLRFAYSFGDREPALVGNTIDRNNVSFTVKRSF
tara:strand:- start:106645 stop:108582 length:1938 start_codon:yes stop_codon:yes gene_type:complete